MLCNALLCKQFQSVIICQIQKVCQIAFSTLFQLAANFQAIFSFLLLAKVAAALSRAVSYQNDVY